MKSLVVVLALACVVAAGDVSAGQAAAGVTIPGFRSPSRNISCLFVPGGSSGSRLLCTISRSSYAGRLQSRCMGPTGAGVDWHGFDLTAAGKGAITCTGGILYNPATQHPSYVTLPYGQSWRQGVFTCSSRVTGITCRSRAGHGVSISRVSWRTW